MPTYEYRCKDCETEFTKFCKISEREEQKECPECHSLNSEKYIGVAPSIGDAVRLGITKLDVGFKEVLQKIDRKTPGSKLKNNSKFL
jgi:putative FmdB family regulatory protein